VRGACAKKTVFSISSDQIDKLEFVAHSSLALQELFARPRKFNCTQSQAARYLDISRTLMYRMEKYSLSREAVAE